MYLTLEEIKQSKSRFISMTLVVLLISFVIFFSAGLAEGLAKGNRFEIERWGATSIQLSDASNNNITASFLEQGPLDREDQARVSTAFATIGDENVALVAFDAGSFIEPDIVEGKKASAKNELVMSYGLKNKGFKVGDVITLDDKISYEVVGFTEASTHFLSQIVYLDTREFQDLKYGVQNDLISGIVYQNSDQGIALQDVIEAIPGYIPQKLTLNLMIYFLIGISSAIVAIFIYIMTLQKRSIFGVLKAQGTPNTYLRLSVVVQSGLISFVAIAIALVATFVMAALLPAAVPFALNPLEIIVYAIILFIASLLGSVFSLKSVNNIDPIEAIGGSL